MACNFARRINSLPHPLTDRHIILYNIKMNFVTIDFETANYSRNSACAVGLVKFQGGQPTDNYYSLIRPPTLYIRPDFTDIHGLTADDVRDAPRFPKIWNDIKNFIGNLPLAAHNSSFDMGVLQAVLEWYELDIPQFSYFCTCNLSRKTWPHLQSHSLPKLAKQFEITYNAHNALDDALTCGKLVLISAKKSGSTNIDELLSGKGILMGRLG